MKTYNERMKSIQKKAKRMKAVRFIVKTTATLLITFAVIVCGSLFGPQLISQLRTIFSFTSDILGQPSTTPSTTVDPLPELKYDSFRVTEEERTLLGVSPSDQVFRLYSGFTDIDVAMGRFNTIPEADALFPYEGPYYHSYIISSKDGQENVVYIDSDNSKVVYLKHEVWKEFSFYARYPESFFPFPVTVNHIYLNFIDPRYRVGYIYFETDQGDYILYVKGSASNLYLFPADVFYKISKAFVAYLDAQPFRPGDGGGRRLIESVWDIEPYKVGVRNPGYLMVYGEDQMQYAVMRSSGWMYNGEESVTSSVNILDPSVNLENDIPWVRTLSSGTLSFKFTVQPDEITVRRWPIADGGKLDAYENGEQVEVYCFLSGVTYYVIARPGTYVYEVTARWNDVSGSSGTATYAFVAEWADN